MFAVRPAPGVVIKLMGCYLALAVLGLIVLLALLENISSSHKNSEGSGGSENENAVDSTKISFQVKCLATTCIANCRGPHHKVHACIFESEEFLYLPGWKKAWKR